MTTIPITDVLKSYSTCNVVLGNTTFTGTVALPATSSVTFNGTVLEQLLVRPPTPLTISINSKTVSGTFTTPQPDTNYQVFVSCGSLAYIPTITNKLTTHFTAMVRSDNSADEIFWTKAYFVVLRVGVVVAYGNVGW